MDSSLYIAEREIVAQVILYRVLLMRTDMREKKEDGGNTSGG
jgi:hypothetical protein